METECILTIRLTTDDRRRFDDLVRIAVGLKGVISPAVSLEYEVYIPDFHPDDEPF